MKGDRQMLPVHTVRMRALTAMGGQPTRFSSAETWLCSGWPTAAMSMTQSRLQLTRPYIRVAGVVLLGRGAAHDAVGAQLDLGRLGRAVVHLDDPGGVREQQLDLAVLQRPPEARLAARAGAPWPCSSSSQVRLCHSRKGRPSWVTLDLLAEVRRLDRGVADDPAPSQRR